MVSSTARAHWLNNSGKVSPGYKQHVSGMVKKLMESFHNQAIDFLD